MTRKPNNLMAIILLAMAALAPPAARAGDHAAGQAIYQNNCARCHGTDGSGAMRGVPDFTGADSALSKPEAELVQNTIEGVFRGMFPMPPRGGNSSLSDQDIVTIVRYMKATFSRKTDGS